MMFGKLKTLHFVGIGGAGMSGIAEILQNLGYNVRGSDSTPSEITTYLEQVGVTIFPSHAPDNISDADVVVISSAISGDNPEVIKARELGIPVIKRAEMLGELMRLKYSIGVAGTHGKTTTTSMIGKIFREAGLQPTLIVGGVVAELGTGASLGSGDYLIAEADEYDRSFLAMFPTLAVVLNLERDHLDCYTDMQDLKNSFLTYINKVPFYGSAILSADDDNLQEILPRVTRPHATFGFSPEADYSATEIAIEPSGTMFSVFCRGELLGGITLRVPGRHNVANALAAVAVSHELDVPFENVADALREFSGVGRRFEIVGDVNGVLVIDDYAHHPTEIDSTLRTARQLYDGRLIVVFQPHLFSRTSDFVSEFARVLSQADQCILTDIYPAREEPIPGVTSEIIKEEGMKQGNRNFNYVGKKENAIAAVANMAKPGDVVLVMGAGSITYIRQQLLESLKA
jgi:UDP-N-acetylmuramate--alanine ligase